MYTSFILNFNKGQLGNKLYNEKNRVCRDKKEKKPAMKVEKKRVEIE